MRHYVSIRNLVVLILAVVYFASVYLGDNLKLKMLVERIYLVSKRSSECPPFSITIANGLYYLLFPDKTSIHQTAKAKNPGFQLLERKRLETKVRKLHAFFLDKYF